MEKRYYWLQLKDDFFDSEQIDYVREQENGAEYIYIYLRLCFLAANNGGVVERRIGPKVIPYSAEKLAAVIKSTPEAVEAAIALFKEIGLAEDTENGAFDLVKAYEMVGSETSAASKKRKQRAGKKENMDTEIEDEAEDKSGDNLGTMSPECPQNVPEMSPECPQNVPQLVPTKNRDKRLEIKDREKEEKEKTSSSSKKQNRKDSFSPGDAIDALSLGAELAGALKAWAEMRETRKRPVSERGLQIGMSELRKLSGGSEATMIAIVNQSIFRGWDGFFPLKNNSPPGAIAGDPDRREQMKQAVEKGGW